MKKVYLATPYSHKLQSVRQARFDAINIIAGDLVKQGYFVLSPITHNHPIALACNISMGWEYWEAYDTVLLEWADTVLVFMNDGWEDSIGVTAEIKIAKQMCKPVGYINKERLAVLEKVGC